MKKILAILSIGALATAGFSQGLVDFNSINSSYAISTNNLATGAIGKTSVSTGTTSPLYYYALLDEAYPGGGKPTTITSGTEPSWTFAASATNYITAGGINGGSTLSVASLTAGTEYYVELVGWSANLGTTWATVSSELANGSWATSAGYFGASAVGTITPTAAPSPAAFLFTANGIPSGFDLTSVPEPTTIALAAMGGLSLLALRRKKA